MKILILPVLLLTSCASTESPWVVEESTQIMLDYTDTLENSVSDAKKVADMMNTQSEKLNNQINR